MEEMNYQPSKIKLSIKQLAKGNLIYDITTRGETVEDAVELMKKTKKEAEVLCNEPKEGGD